MITWTCCDEMKHFAKEMDNVYFHVGDGECSGSIWIEPTHISFDDGWNFYPRLELRFCPFCGAKAQVK